MLNNFRQPFCLIFSYLKRFLFYFKDIASSNAKLQPFKMSKMLVRIFNVKHIYSPHQKSKELEERIRYNTRLLLFQPPIGEAEVPQLGKWVKKEVKASGTSWDVNSIDIAVAGLGWFSLGLKGEASLALWTYDGIEITLREPLVLDRAPCLERPGFWLPKAISDAVGNQTKLEAQARKEHQETSMAYD